MQVFKVYNSFYRRKLSSYATKILTLLHKFIMKYVKRKYIFYPFRTNETVKGSHARLLSENAQRAIWLVTKAHQTLLDYFYLCPKAVKLFFLCAETD